MAEPELKVLRTKVKQAVDILTTPEPPREIQAEKRAGAGEPLNFRVDPDFRRRFRVYAAQRGMRLQDVLVKAFELLEASDG